LLNKLRNNISVLKSIQFLPRWIILSIDISIVIFSATIAYFILKGVGVNFDSLIPLPVGLAVFVLIHIIYFWSFKTFTGIVRHTSLNDAAKLFFVESLCFISLYILNLIIAVLYERLFLNTSLLITIAITYGLLLLFRLSIKISFDFFSE